MKKIKKIMMTLTMVAFMFGLANIGSVKVQAATPSIDKSVTYNLYILFWIIIIGGIYYFITTKNRFNEFEFKSNRSYSK